MQSSRNPRSSANPVASQAVITGILGGIFFSGIGFLFHYFQFTEVNPRLILGGWAGPAWRDGWLGTMIAMLIYGVLSAAAAMIYYFLLKTRKSMWWGGGYGVLIYALLFLVIYPLFPGVKYLLTYPADTIITQFCLFLVYGVFIGYSISYAYYDWKHGAES